MVEEIVAHRELGACLKENTDSPTTRKQTQHTEQNNQHTHKATVLDLIQVEPGTWRAAQPEKRLQMHCRCIELLLDERYFRPLGHETCVATLVLVGAGAEVVETDELRVSRGSGQTAQDNGRVQPP